MHVFFSSRFFFFSIIFPFLISVVLYQLDSFDPAHFPADSLLSYHKDSGLIYTGCVDGWVKRVSIHDSANDSVVEDWVNTGGRPLGIDFGLHGEVIVADANKGLLNISGDGKKTELLTEEAEGVSFKITDAVVVADNGVLYFTDASSKYNIHQFNFDFLEGKPNGRLLSFDPTTRVTRVLLRDLYFANGVSMSPDQTHLVFCETVMRRCSKYYINEKREEVFIKGLPGYPDNIRYDGDGHYWIAMITGETTLWKLTMKYPFLRKLTAMAAKYGFEVMVMKNAGVMQVDLSGNPIALFHDHLFSHITSGVKIGNHLYCGNLLHSYITRLDLLKYPAQRKL